MKIIDTLLEIKKFREAQAQTKLVKQRARHARARTERDTAEDTLSTHKVTAKAQELAWFGELMGQQVRVHIIESVRAEVGLLTATTHRLTDDLQQAETTLDQERQAVDVARQGVVRAEQVKEKFVQLVRIYADAAFLQAERAEDLEMEEVASLRRERSEWDQPDTSAEGQS